MPLSRRNVMLALGSLPGLWLPHAHASGLQRLADFLRIVQSAKAEFTQTVVPPAREGQSVRPRVSSGVFEFQRPGRFRFEYRKPFEQVIVADGQNLWLHDVDLNQVTVRKQAQALGATPAALLASSADIKALQADFDLSEAPDRDGQQWIVAVPRARDTQIQSVRIGLRGQELATLEMTDGFGQRSTLVFSRFEANPTLPADTFRFRPPSGSDVVRP